MILTLLLASLGFGQSTSTLTYPQEGLQQTVSPEFEMTLSNLGKDVRDLQNGRPTITGIPLFQDGFCVGTRATCQTTAGGTAPTRQVLTSGTNATYTTPAGAKFLRIRACGGGGGGGAYGSTGSSPGAGGTTSFNSITAVGGSAGALNTNTQAAGGAGGTGGAGTAPVRIAGQAGSAGGTGSFYAEGGNSPFGGGGRTPSCNAAGTAAAANSCSGGGAGCGNSSYVGGGGGAGEYIEFTIASPGASYTYTVGAGSAGWDTDQQDGGAGGSGIIIVDEYY